MAVFPLAIAVTLFIKMVCYPIHGPNLSMVSVSAEL